jgi:hypothetical protein
LTLPDLLLEGGPVREDELRGFGRPTVRRCGSIVAIRRSSHIATAAKTLLCSMPWANLVLAAVTFYGSGVRAGRFGMPSMLDLASTLR